MNTEFTGKKLLVVGGTSGMGLATAKRVIENGGSVVLVGNRQEKAEQARHALREHVSHYDDDRFFAPDIDKAMQLLEEGRLVGLLPSVL